jgi:hypothetical protein
LQPPPFGDRAEASKRFFLKKEAKTLAPWLRACCRINPFKSNSFLVRPFKKERLLRGSYASGAAWRSMTSHINRIRHGQRG